MRMRVWLLLLLLWPMPWIPNPRTNAAIGRRIEMPGMIAKSHCPHKCGNVTVPYPFGMRKLHCAKDETFLLQCIRHANGHHQLLLGGNTSVLDISLLQGTATVTINASPKCYSDVTMKPFMFSRAMNSVILDWVVGEETCNAARNMPGTYACSGQNTVCLDYTDRPGYRCLCKDGFHGNPYLPQGCQDIDECKDPRQYPCKGTCRNIVGSYTCSCPFGMYANGEADCRRHDGTTVALAIWLGIGFLLVIAGLFWLNQFMKKKKNIKLKKASFTTNGGLLLQQQISSDKCKLEKLKIFSSEELENATDHYNKNHILGKGSQGTVYKGMLPDGSMVAVKKSEKMDEAQTGHYINEVVILSQINHRHVVKLLGCCLETEIPLLVYEFVSNGTLSDHIHDQQKEFSMTWSDRLRIAKEVAGAIAYMHSAAEVPIYHRDIKSSNILLDEKYSVKLSDFGISRSVPTEKTHLTTCVQGTFGYLDPEYFRSNKYTEKSDVYSFGVVLIELLTGQKPISRVRTEDIGLAARFISSAKGNHLVDVLDPQVVMEGEEEELVILADLAMRCLKLNGRKRPTMKQVSLELENLKKPQQYLPAAPDHAEEDYFIMESSRSLDPSNADWVESGGIRENELDIDIQKLLNNSSSVTYQSGEA